MLNGDTVASITSLGRELAEAVMVDACTVTAPSGAPVWDAATGRDVPATGASLYAGPCRVQAPQVQVTDADAGGHDWSTRQVVVSIPVSSIHVPPGAVVTVTASRLDPDLVGRRYRVVSALAKTAASARRLTCEEVTT